MRYLYSGVLLVLMGVGVYAGATFHRQYYSNGSHIGQWHYHPQHRVHSIYYKYRPSHTVNTYSHHVAYYYPSRPKYVYFYNPQTRSYWGRCPVDYSPTNPYQILDYADRKGDLADIDESRFQPLPARLNPPGQPQVQIAGTMPPIPGSVDNEQMLPPPPPPAMPPAE